MCIYIYNREIYTYVHIYLHIYIGVLCMCVCIYIYIYIYCIYVYTCNMCIYIYTCICEPVWQATGSCSVPIIVKVLPAPNHDSGIISSSVYYNGIE